MVKKIRCKYEPEDHIRAEIDRAWDEVDIRLDIMVDGEDRMIYLTPENARKLRKQIKKALAEIEGEGGVSEPEETPSSPPAGWVPKVGEIVEVYRNTVGHGFGIGDRVKVDWVSGKVAGATHPITLKRWACGADIRPLTA